MWTEQTKLKWPATGPGKTKNLKYFRSDIFPVKYENVFPAVQLFNKIRVTQTIFVTIKSKLNKSLIHFQLSK